MQKLIAAIDQGTTSTRCLLIDESGKVISTAQKEHKQIYPQPGWVEHDPIEIWKATQDVIQNSISQVNIPLSSILGVGITNQRETTILWNKKTGIPYHNAIVWQDTRTKEICEHLENKISNSAIYKLTGLPISTYFSGPKIKWLFDNIPMLGKDAKDGLVLFGNIDTWLTWMLTGGPSSGKHVTDVTNASRTMLMNLNSMNWDPEILRLLEIPESILPRIIPSSISDSPIITQSNGPFMRTIPIGGILGDQQAALVGQACFLPGEAKNTYGTGCFLLLNTGTELIHSNHGLLTTVAFQFGQDPVHYALEGSVAIAGALVQWIRDNLELISDSSEIETLAASVENNGDIYFVPAFSGLFAPYWRTDARGVIVGLTRFVNKGHLARAVLEATAYQTRDILEAMKMDSGKDLRILRVDGGMVKNNLLMQFQADLLGVPVVRPKITETTALGAAYAAGLAVGLWTDINNLRNYWQQDHEWQPKMTLDTRNLLYSRWKKAVERSLNWI